MKYLSNEILKPKAHICSKWTKGLSIGVINKKVTVQIF